MKVIAELLEGFVIVLIIGVVVLLGTATLIHAIFDRPEYRADLTTPPAALLCPDSAGHCRAAQ